MESNSVHGWFEEIPEYFSQDVDAIDLVDHEIALHFEAVFEEPGRARTAALCEGIRGRLGAYLPVHLIADALAEAGSSSTGLRDAEVLAGLIEGDDGNDEELLRWVRRMARRWARRIAKRDGMRWRSRRLAVQSEDDEIDAVLSSFAYDCGIIVSAHPRDSSSEFDKLLRVSPRLRAKEYCVFILRALDEFSFAAIGNLIGSTAATVRELYYYVVAKLRGWLGGGGGALAPA